MRPRSAWQAERGMLLIPLCSAVLMEAPSDGVTHSHLSSDSISGAVACRQPFTRTQTHTDTHIQLINLLVSVMN